MNLKIMSRFIWPALFIGILVTGLAASKPVQAAKPGEIVVGITVGPTTFNPWDLGNFAYPLNAQFYNRLIHYNDKMEPQPELAESWTFSPDGKKLTLKLRKGVKFHSGKELTAKDVAWSLKQATTKGIQANLKPLAKLVKEAKVVNSHTITLEFGKPNPAVFDLLDLLFIVDGNWDKIRTQPIGSGPFVLAEYVPGSKLILKPNANYWKKGVPKLERVELRVINDPQALILNLESGTVDAIYNFPAREVKRLDKSGKFNVGIAAQGSLVFDVLFNTSWGPLKDARVRQAINYMINRKRFTRIVLSGASEPQCLPWPKHSLAYDKTLNKSCEFNPDKAKKLLAEAGFADGFDLTILTSTQRSADWTKLAEMLQSDLGKVGIRAKVQDIEAAAHLQRQRAGDFEISMHNFGRGNKDPASLFGTATVWKPLANSSHYRNEEFTNLTNEAATTMDKAKRKALYNQINKLILRDLFITSVAANPRPWAANKRIKNMRFSVDGFILLENAHAE